MKKSDLDQTAKVFHLAFNDAGENWPVANAKKHVEENFLGGKCHFVAVIDNKIVGLLLGITSTREPGKEIFLDTIAVLPRWQNKGIGERLWQRMIKFLKTNKFTGIRLTANREFKSFNWYRQKGFKESGWIEVYKKI